MRKFVFVFVISIVIFPVTAASSSFAGPPTPLDQLIEGCDFAFTGVAGPSTDGEGFYRYYEFTDIDSVIGEYDQSSIQLRIRGGTVGNISMVTTAPQSTFTEGKRYLVFVYDDNGIFREYMSPFGQYLLDDNPTLDNVIETRSESTIEEFVVPGRKASPELNSVLVYLTCLTLFVSTFYYVNTLND